MIERTAIILLCNFLFYLKTLGYKYCSDDIPVLKRPKHPNKWGQRYRVLRGDARSNPITDHTITIIIHAIICTFIYIGFGANNVSFVAALLFSVNPINNQVSVWISGRGYAWAALGLTGALVMPWIAPAWLFLATRYIAGFTTVLVFFGSSIPWVVLFFPIYIVVNGIGFKKSVSNKIKDEMFDEDKRIHPVKLILGIKTFGFYTIHALIPIKTTFYHSFLQSAAGSKKNKAYTMKDRFFWIGLLFVISIGLYWAYTPWNMVSFGILWWCIGIAPFCNVMRMQQEISERYVYVPNIGLMYVLAHFIIKACL